MSRVKKEKDENNNKNKRIKKIIFIIIGLLLVIVIALFLTKFIYNDNKKEEEVIPDPEEGVYNTRAEVIETKEVEGIVFSNINCYYDGTNTIITYTITNTNDAPVNIGWYKIIAYDDTMTVIKTLRLYLDYELTSQEEYEETLSTATDFTNVYTLEIVLDNGSN